MLAVGDCFFFLRVYSRGQVANKSSTLFVHSFLGPLTNLTLSHIQIL
nr:MAG TPA: hypothetical protein [Caudoviricetes sp.]